MVDLLFIDHQLLWLVVELLDKRWLRVGHSLIKLPCFEHLRLSLSNELAVLLYVLQPNDWVGQKSPYQSRHPELVVQLLEHSHVSRGHNLVSIVGEVFVSGTDLLES